MKWDLLKPKKNESHELEHPFSSSVNDLFSSFDSMMDHFFRDTNRSLAKASFNPDVDVTEDEKNVYVHAELPGMEESDINVTLMDNMLTIKGEKKEEKKNNKQHSIERSYGYFERSFRVPDTIKQDTIEATFKKGVLSITLPKDSSKESKTVKINVN